MTQSQYIPTDTTPTIPGFTEVTTRIIYGQWINTDGTGITTAPKISYVNLPYFISGKKVNIFGGDVANRPQATVLAQPTSGGQPIPGTVGIWYAEVICQDPDLVGDVAVKIEHSVLPGGSLTIAVPLGDGSPLNVADARLVVGSSGSMVAVAGPPGPAGPAGPPGPAGSGIQIQGVVTTASALPGSAAVGQAWITSNDGHLHVWTASNAWADTGPIVGPAGPAGTAGAAGPTGPPGPAGQGVPTGGTTGQVLAKNSATNYDTDWVDAPTGGGGGPIDETNLVEQVVRSGTSPWGPRPTTNSSTVVMWIGAGDDPANVTSGTGGMYPNDLRVIIG
jgi:hypothetical protein